MKKNINSIIEKRRRELGLRDIYVAEKIGLNIDSYCDIEWHEDEISEFPHLKEVKKLFLLLQLDFFEMVDLICPFCSKQKKYDLEYNFPRNELINKRRKDLNMTTAEFADKVGYYEIAILEMEEDPDFLEEWPISEILLLSDIISTPPQILFAVKCKNCGR